jgi:hypothetical protein
VAEQLELGAGRTWIRGLEQEFALKLAPHVGKDGAKKLAAAMARLAGRRAGEVGEGGTAAALVTACGGCQTDVLAHEALCLCSTCANNVMLIVD